MIELKVEKYCDNCPDFEAEVNKFPDFDLYGNPIFVTCITCANEDRCKAIKEHLKRNWDI